MPYVETNDIETYYEEYGAGPPIIFAHGGTSDHQLWAEQAQPLTDEYRVIVYDIRGHGKTGPSEMANYTIDLYADDLHEFITALELNDPAICGLSLGGMITETYAVRYNELSAAVLIGTLTPEIFSSGEWAYRKGVMRAMGPIMSSERLREGFTWLGEQVFGEGSAGEVDQIEQIRHQHSDEALDIDATERQKMVDAVVGLASTPLDFSSISVPVLVMYGEQEPMVPRHAAYLKQEMSDVEVREIPGAGHNSHIDNPEFITNSLREFLQV